MKTARFLINTGKSTKTDLRSISVETARTSISGVLSMHNRAFHQYIQKDISNTSPIMATRSPTSLPTENLKLQQGIQRRLISIQTPSIVSQASFSTEAIVPQEPTIHSSYETKTGTWQYVIADPSTLKAVIIDSVLDYDPATQVISTQTADSLVSLISENGYKIEKILETHAHADHLTAASYLQNRVGQQQGYRPPVCIGKRITQVQDLFGQRYGIPVEEYKGAFDQLFDDDESFKIGNLTATVTHLPGHTPDHIGYMIGDNVFCGDSLFHADIGTARCDFPGGSAASLYESGHKLLKLPEYIKIWTGHDYVSDERDTPVPWMSVRDHKERNKHLSQGITQHEFVSRREERDATLEEPKLLNPSLQINIRAGRLPRPTILGNRFLHLPLKLKGAEW